MTTTLRLTNLTTGETHDVTNAGVLFIPEALTFPETPPAPSRLPPHLSMTTIEVTDTLVPPNPELVALMTGNPWDAVSFRQAQQLSALRAMA